MYKFFVMLKRDLLNLVQNPILLNYNTLFPLLLILILGFLTGGGYGNTGINGYDFYGITMLLYIVINVSVTAANSFMEKGLKASNLRVLYSPIPNAFIYLSKIAATFIFTSACFAILMPLSHVLLGVNFGGGNWIYVLALVFLLDLLFAILGVMFCCIFKSEEITNQILSTVNNIFAILGGLFFQLDGFGKAVERLTYISPVKWATKGIFKIIYDGDLTWFLPTVAAIAGLSILMLLVCKMTFRSEDYV